MPFDDTGGLVSDDDAAVLCLQAIETPDALEVGVIRREDGVIAYLAILGSTMWSVEPSGARWTVVLHTDAQTRVVQTARTATQACQWLVEHLGPLVAP